MAKKPGPKEQALRDQREAAAPSLFDASTIRERIKAALAKELEPLDAEIQRQKGIRDEAERTIAELEKVKGQITGQAVQGGESSVGGRRRRSRDELERVARAIHDFVGTKKDGASGGEIRAGVPGADLVQDLKGFVEQYGCGKLKTEGQRAGMRYFVG